MISRSFWVLRGLSGKGDLGDRAFFDEWINMGFFSLWQSSRDGRRFLHRYRSRLVDRALYIRFRFSGMPTGRRSFFDAGPFITWE